MALNGGLKLKVKPGSWSALLIAAVAVALAVGSLASSASAEQQSPYKVSEVPIRVASDLQSYPAISGKWVLWKDKGQATREISGLNLETGLNFAISTVNDVNFPVDVDGDVVVALEYNGSSEWGIFGYRLPEGSRFNISPLKGDAYFSRSTPRISGSTVVWAEGHVNAWDIYAYDLASQQLLPISTNPAHQEALAISGNYVVWLDKRNSSATAFEGDIFGYDLSTKQEFRVTATTEQIGPPAVSGTTVAWWAHRADANYLLGYDLAKKQEFTITQLPSSQGLVTPDIDGDLVVWSASGQSVDYDVYGYDLKQGQQFVISRAIGDQMSPQVSGNTVVWVDTRRSGVGKYEHESDIYGAKLEPGPAPAPPLIGAPDAADAKIEIVWPHGGAPVTQADEANIGAWLFQPGTLNLVPCQWNPKVQLWRALNNEPARMVAQGRKQGDHYYVGGRSVPTWEFNDVDVSAARDPKNKLYFFVTLDGVPSNTNIWSHGADARTYFPQQDVVAGVTPVSGPVEAKIEIVWPHENAPVEQAKLVNISASLFSPGTLLSVPSDWSPSVRLYRALNNDVSREVAVGEKRLVQRGGFTYPVWDFNDVDVSAANDPVNKYYFTLRVDGVETHTNVWAHGADARTYFPQMDTPTQGCQ